MAGAADLDVGSEFERLAVHARVKVDRVAVARYIERRLDGLVFSVRSDVVVPAHVGNRDVVNDIIVHHYLGGISSIPPCRHAGRVRSGMHRGGVAAGGICYHHVGHAVPSQCDVRVVDGFAGFGVDDRAGEAANRLVGAGIDCGQGRNVAVRVDVAGECIRFDHQRLESSRAGIERRPGGGFSPERHGGQPTARAEVLDDVRLHRQRAVDVWMHGAVGALAGGGDETAPPGRGVQLKDVPAPHEGDGLRRSRHVAFVDVVGPVSLSDQSEGPVACLRHAADAVESDDEIGTAMHLAVVELQVNAEALARTIGVRPKPRARGIEGDAQREVAATDRFHDLRVDVAVEFRKEIGPRVAIASWGHAVVGEVPIRIVAVDDLEAGLVQHDAVPAKPGLDRLFVVGPREYGAAGLRRGARERQEQRCGGCFCVDA